jgi:hypothetical protein
MLAAFLLHQTTTRSRDRFFNFKNMVNYGISAEWIMERPTVNGSFANLTNYVACPFDACYACGSINGGTYNFYIAIQALLVVATKQIPSPTDWAFLRSGPEP